MERHIDVEEEGIFRDDKWYVVLLVNRRIEKTGNIGKPQRHIPAFHRSQG